MHALAFPFDLRVLMRRKGGGRGGVVLKIDTKVQFFRQKLENFDSFGMSSQKLRLNDWCEVLSFQKIKHFK